MPAWSASERDQKYASTACAKKMLALINNARSATASIIGLVLNANPAFLCFCLLIKADRFRMVSSSRKNGFVADMAR